MKGHYHLTIRISLERIKVLKRFIPILNSPDFNMKLIIENLENDPELEAELKSYLLGCMLAIEQTQRIQ